MKSILVAMPTYTGRLPISVVSRMLHLEVPKDCHLNFRFLERGLIDKARNGMAQVAIDKKEDYIFFWDDDQIPDQDILVKMIELDKDIVGCPIPSRRGERWIAVIDENGEKMEHIKKTQEVGGIGMANTLIKIKVIKEMFKKWKNPFEFTIVKNNEDVYVERSEDVTFCRRAKDLGFETWCHTDIKSLHIGYPMAYYYDKGEYVQKLLM